ncbi:hypothetical protein BASA81_000061 [Batrachochytrium salamandrivorans]|nr:hypothetical protein BASA81_000061 [Batrachochytrium salamandrivorans]
MLRLAFVALFALLLQVALGQDAFDDGYWEVESIELGTIKAPLPQFAPFHATVHYPTSCNSQCGPFFRGGVPVLLFVTGFAGSLPTSQYTSILSRAAKQGVVIVAVDQDLTGFQLTLDISRFGSNLQKLVAYIRSGELLTKIKNPGTGKTRFLNTDGLYQNGAKIFYGGHSSGAHIAIQNVVDLVNRNHVCPAEVAGFVMLSPLDGQDPLGFGGNFAIVPHDERLLFTSPGLIVAGSLDRVSGVAVNGMPCVPDDRGNVHFLHGWPGYCQYNEAEGMGTLDVLDETATTSYDQFCAASNRSTMVEARTKYRNMVKGSIVTFMQTVVTGQSLYKNKLTNLADLAFPMKKMETHEGSTGPGCTYYPVVVTLTDEQSLGMVLFAITFALSFVCGLCYIFQKMDAETTHRYYTSGDLEYENVASFQTKLEPQYSMSQQFPNNAPSQSYAPSQNFNPRQVSINV